ncbi:MAG: hypothetical protein EXR72_08805 [Myxococcales bacterium]|nr:hypothetical protein [Myxococcales bacterium]
MALKLEEGGAFRCEVTCPGAADPSVIAGLGYRSAAGVVLPGIGRGPDQPLVVPIGSDGTLLFSAELIARGSLLSEPCR